MGSNPATPTTDHRFRRRVLAWRRYGPSVSEATLQTPRSRHRRSPVRQRSAASKKHSPGVGGLHGAVGNRGAGRRARRWRRRGGPLRPHQHRPAAAVGRQPGGRVDAVGAAADRHQRWAAAFGGLVSKALAPEDLRRGDTGWRVSALQQQLNGRGAEPALKVDGIFGPKTAQGRRRAAAAPRHEGRRRGDRRTARCSPRRPQHRRARSGRGVTRSRRRPIRSSSTASRSGLTRTATPRRAASSSSATSPWSTRSRRTRSR